MDKKKILIVEDEEDLRFLIAEGLKKIGYVVYQAGNGDEGLKVAAEMRPDLIISDIVMPKKDGNQFLKELRQKDFGKKIPFIVLSVHVKMRDYFEILGVAAFVDKPFVMEDLASVIEKVLASEQVLGKHAPLSSQKDKNAKDKVVIGDEAVRGIVLGMEERTTHEEKTFRVDEEKHESAEEKKQKQSLIGKKKILVLEDDASVFRCLKGGFSENVYALQVVTFPDKFILESETFMPDLIILKHMVGQANSERLAERLRESSTLRWTPIIIYDNIFNRVEKRKESGEIEARLVLSAEGKKLISKIQELFVK